MSSIAILGCGNIGSSIAKGLVKSGIDKDKMILTCRKLTHLQSYQEKGYKVTQNNVEAVKNSEIIFDARK